MSSLRRIRDALAAPAALDALPDESARHHRLCELNAIEQVVNVSQTTIVRDAWARAQTLSVHGWIYALRDGLLRDLGRCVTGEAELPHCYESALSAAPV